MFVGHKVGRCCFSWLANVFFFCLIVLRSHTKTENKCCFPVLRSQYYSLCHQWQCKVNIPPPLNTDFPFLIGNTLNPNPNQCMTDINCVLSVCAFFLFVFLWTRSFFEQPASLTSTRLNSTNYYFWHLIMFILTFKFLVNNFYKLKMCISQIWHYICGSWK